MFERRLKIFLFILLVVTGVLILRAALLQVWQQGQWREQASKAMQRPVFTETVRGRILDFRDREVAVDVPCTDACIEYAALTPNPSDVWLTATARRRLAQRLGDEYTAADKPTRIKLLAQERERITADLAAMWTQLAQVSGKSVDEIQETRHAIVQRIEMRRRYLWYRNWEKAADKSRSEQEKRAWYRKLLLDAAQDGEAIDKFALTLEEQTESHVLLSNVTTSVSNYLAKNTERFPGLVLRSGVVRFYPYGDAAAHVIGHLSRVRREDLEQDDTLLDELRRYEPNDNIGRTGVEALAEPLLRGSRGRIVKVQGQDQPIETLDARTGGDIRMTIDIELQQEIEAMFKRVTLIQKDINGHVDSQVSEMNGAVVVIDVPSGEVRALASWPTFDLNRFQQEYADLSRDDLRRPFLNRATQFALEPGSTVKPIIGLGAITSGLSNPAEAIECTSHLILRGKQYSDGKCWTAHYAKLFPAGHVMHHPGHPTGFLNISDGIERSCNIYFENMADRLGLEGVTFWFDQFGLGRPTGIGIGERWGRIPGPTVAGPFRAFRSTVWFAGIGQGQVLATPIQMANVAATIARDGVLLRPRLLTGANLPPPKSSQPNEKPIRDAVDLHISPAALQAVKQGMTRVVQGDYGTGRDAASAQTTIAGKTGSAQAAKFRIPLRDESGKPLKDQEGDPVYQTIEPSTFAQQNPQAPWYRAFGAEGTEISHAWFIGFAPADKPQIAVAVFVEYGGTGGSTAGALGKQVVEACVEHGYLAPNTSKLKVTRSD